MKYLTSIGIYLLVIGYLIWRVRADILHKRPLGQSATWLIYMIPFAGIALVSWVTPPWPRALSIAVVAVWILACATTSYKTHSKYNRWLDEQREREKYQR